MKHPIQQMMDQRREGKICAADRLNTTNLALTTLIQFSR